MLGGDSDLGYPSIQKVRTQLFENKRTRSRSRTRNSPTYHDSGPLWWTRSHPRERWPAAGYEAAFPVILHFSSYGSHPDDVHFSYRTTVAVSQSMALENVLNGPKSFIFYFD